MKTRLPTISALLAFEAVARHLNFRKASEELCVTHAAISHQIKTLEETIDEILLNRDSHSVSLTTKGRQYLPSVRSCLSELLDATKNLKESTSSLETLTVQSYHSFINKWMMPRLINFQLDNPNIMLRVKSSFEDGNIDDHKFDIGIFKGPPFDLRMVYTELFTTKLTPVCSPEILKNNPIESVEDISKHTLLIVPQNRYETIDWHQWLNKAGISVANVKFSPTFDNYPMAHEALIEGKGIAIARDVFVESDVKAGLLVTPINLSIPESGSWYLAAKEDMFKKPAFNVFYQWLLAELNCTSTISVSDEAIYLGNKLNK